MDGDEGFGWVVDDGQGVKTPLMQSGKPAQALLSTDAQSSRRRPSISASAAPVDFISSALNTACTTHPTANLEQEEE
jgi:hypothetical protein